MMNKRVSLIALGTALLLATGVAISAPFISSRMEDYRKEKQENELKVITSSLDFLRKSANDHFYQEGSGILKIEAQGQVVSTHTVTSRPLIIQVPPVRRQYQLQDIERAKKTAQWLKDGETRVEVDSGEMLLLRVPSEYPGVSDQWEIYRPNQGTHYLATFLPQSSPVEPPAPKVETTPQAEPVRTEGEKTIKI